MPASDLKYSAAHLIYALSLNAASVSLFGAWGLLVAAFVVLIWWQIFCSARREVAHFDSAKVTGCRRNAFLKTELAVGLLFTAILLGMMLPTRSDVDPMQHAETSLKMVAKAVAAYETQYGSPLPNIVRDDHGNPMHSWRALILKQLGEDQLAAKYRLDEPWNGPNNSKLLKRRPWHFRNYYPTTKPQSGTSTHLLTINQHSVIVEHESLMVNWMEPNAIDCSLWNSLNEIPELGEGFWKHGFFMSKHQGRLACVDAQAFEVHVNGQVDGSILGRDSPGMRVAIGTPYSEFHGLNVVRLAFFLLVTLLPIRWLKHAQSAK